MCYEAFYGLAERPFAITPNPAYFYESAQHRVALTKLKDAIDTSKGLSVVIGDIGLGKTFLSRKLTEYLQEREDQYEASLFIVIHHEVTVSWLLKVLASHLGLETLPEDKTAIISLICRKLVEVDQSGKKSVVLMDEAHMLQSREIYEELRGLLNVEVDNHKVFNIVLFAPPELEKYMALDPPLVSRIGLKITLQPLTQEEVAEYIAHRLRVAGAARDLFSPEAAQMVHRFSQGVPRLINTICENALLEGFLDKAETISPQIVDRAATDLGLHATALPPSAEELAKLEQQDKERKKRGRVSYI